MARKTFGAEGSLQNNSLKVSGSIGTVTETGLTMLVDGGFFIFNFSATRTLKVCRKRGLPSCRVRNTCSISTRSCPPHPPKSGTFSHNRVSQQGTGHDYGHLCACKLQPTVYIRIANSSRGARQLGWANNQNKKKKKKWLSSSGTR